MVGGGGWVVFFFFKQKTAYEVGTGDWSSDVCSSDLSLRQRPLFLLTIPCCGSAPAFYTAHFSLRQRPAFFLPNSCCGSAPSFYPAHFLLRQHPRFLYCPFLVAAAPRHLYCPILVEAAPQLFTAHFFSGIPLPLLTSLIYFCSLPASFS